MRYIVLILLLIGFAVPGWAMEVKSASFVDGSVLSSRYACQGENISPDLSWSDVPAGTQSFAVVCDDLDSRDKQWSHWVIFNIAPSETNLPEGISHSTTFGSTALQGINDFKEIGYSGPCPPSGATHRYVFKLYALDTVLSLGKEPQRQAFLEAIQGHILAEAQTDCLYSSK